MAHDQIGDRRSEQMGRQHGAVVCRGCGMSPERLRSVDPMRLIGRWSTSTMVAVSVGISDPRRSHTVGRGEEGEQAVEHRLTEHDGACQPRSAQPHGTQRRAERHADHQRQQNDHRMRAMMSRSRVSQGCRADRQMGSQDPTQDAGDAMDAAGGGHEPDSTPRRTPRGQRIRTHPDPAAPAGPFTPDPHRAPGHSSPDGRRRLTARCGARSARGTADCRRFQTRPRVVRS